MLIPARMRVDGEWTDVVLHNLSAHGALVAGDNAPSKGSYVELRRGNQLIIGRVVWSKDRFFGIRTQDKLDIPAIINEPRLARRPQGRGPSTPALVDRRRETRMDADARLARQFERSRHYSSVLQFALFAVAALSAAGLAAMQVHEVLAAPFAIIEGQLRK